MKNQIPYETEQAVLALVRDGKTSVEAATILNISRNRAAGAVSKNGGVIRIRGYEIRRTKYSKTKVAKRICYVQGCGGEILNRPHEDFRMCESCRATATYASSGLGLAETCSGTKRGFGGARLPFHNG